MRDSVARREREGWVNALGPGIVNLAGRSVDPGLGETTLAQRDPRGMAQRTGCPVISAMVS